jgi:hypothetical protein
LPDDQGYRDDATVHGQNVLKAISHIRADPEVFILGPLL